MLAPVGDLAAEPIGVVLAGGLGRRLGGDKAVTALGGRPLIAYPLAAMRAAVANVAIVAKADTLLPGPEQLDGAEVWIEPPQPRHPLVGILHALRAARGRAVLVCASDMPLVTAAALRALAVADAGPAPAVLACSPDGAMQPLLGRYEPAAAALLERAAGEAAAPVRAAVAAIGPRLVALDDPVILFNVNSPGDLIRAEAILAEGGQPGARRA